MLKTIECVGKNVPLGAYIENDIVTKNDVLLLKQGTVVNDQVKEKLAHYNGYVKISIEATEEVEEEVKEVVMKLEKGTSVANDYSLTLDDTIKEQALKGVEYMYSNANTNEAAIVAKDTSTMLLDAIQNSSDVNICINNIKVSDDYTFKHCVDVATMAVLVGKKLGLPQKTVANAATAGILHDLGKVKIPNEILNKPGKLTDEEFAIIKKHPVYGYKILSSSTVVSESVKRGVLMHHEKADGTGYPLGVSVEKIDILGKLLSVVDVYDALVTKRPYREDMIEPATAVEMMLGMGNQFDIKFLNGFLNCVILYPIGSYIVLSNGRIYEVMEQNVGYPLRPVVKDVETGQMLNLLTDKSCFSLIIATSIK